MPKQLLASFVSFLLLMPATVFAQIVLHDNFEDGNYTSDPTWSANPDFYGVITDVTDPDNLVLQGTGGGGQHLPISTEIVAAWDDFYFAVDIMSSDPPDFDPIFVVSDIDQTVAGGYWWHQFSNQGCLGEAGQPAASGSCCPLAGPCLILGASQSTPMQWYRYELWHDPSSPDEPIRVRFSNLTTGTTLAQGGFASTAPFQTASIGLVKFDTERVHPYYYDNVILANAAADCNENGVPDAVDILRGDSTDCNENDVPDECDQCLGDLNCDGAVRAADLAILLGSWGPCGDPNDCPADIAGDGDGLVGADDLATLLGSWGPCD